MTKLEFSSSVATATKGAETVAFVAAEKSLKDGWLANVADASVEGESEAEDRQTDERPGQHGPDQLDRIDRIQGNGSVHRGGDAQPPKVTSASSTGPIERISNSTVTGLPSASDVASTVVGTSGEIPTTV